MPTVAYPHEFPYRQSPAGGTFPILPITIGTPHQLTRSADVIAYLDSGAQRSLSARWRRRSGWTCSGDVDCHSPPPRDSSIEAIIHPVRLFHPDLGDFNLEIGFSTIPLRRNLLGRDFFSLVQIGFRERRQVFYVRAEP